MWGSQLKLLRDYFTFLKRLKLRLELKIAQGKCTSSRRFKNGVPVCDGTSSRRHQFATAPVCDAFIIDFKNDCNDNNKRRKLIPRRELLVRLPYSFSVSYWLAQRFTYWDTAGIQDSTNFIPRSLDAWRYTLEGFPRDILS
jgi:hypothetical protein